MEPWRNPRPREGGNLRVVESFAGLRVTVLEGGDVLDEARPVEYFFDERGVLIARALA